ncbi:transposase [Natronocella acetinitrilica]|uniref:Transposase n=1 Tax=Natronocella acetinitrilica TaxID=414046 RepID=A0AAE3G2M6_9GAMM|nr:transposase [Natronocella acetinitrilica]
MDTKVDENKRGPKRTRRRFSLASKKQMVAETLKDGASVSLVARRYNVNTNQLFKWRNLLQLELAKLKRMQFGRSSENLDHQVAQLELAIEEMETEGAKSDVLTGVVKPCLRDRIYKPAWFSASPSLRPGWTWPSWS